MEQTQKINQKRLLEEESDPALQPAAPQVKTPENPNPFAKKIKLKELMHANLARSGNYEEYIKLEIQHVEQAEVQQQVQQQEVQLVQLEVEDQIQDLAEEVHGEYHGELVDYYKFQGQPYYGLGLIADHYPDGILRDKGPSYTLASKDLFGRFPQSIKHLTYEAAMQISRNLLVFATLNRSNLPANFFMRPGGVLDYDPYTTRGHINPFTPIPSPFVQKWYDGVLSKVTFYESNVKKWINNDALFKKICIRYFKKRSYWGSETDQLESKFNADSLTNLWVKYGDKGCERFFGEINLVDKTHPDFSVFLYDHYLKYFFQYDELMDQNRLPKAMRKIGKMNAVQLECFKKFMENTGPSRHCLLHTVEAFDYFWDNLDKLCKKKKVPIELINCDWSTPQGGSPEVYMERLLTILTNARNLNEQMQCLPGLVLDNYGAYYASKYNNFKVVSKEMDFRRENSYKNGYEVSLAMLHELVQNPQMTDEERQQFQSAIFRFVGKEKDSVAVPVLKQALEELKQAQPQLNASAALYLGLLFTSNGRLVNQSQMSRLLKAAAGLQVLEPEVLKSILGSLTELYSSGIKIPIDSGIVLCEKIAQINSKEFNAILSVEDKINYLNRFFNQFKKNKYAAFKGLNHLSKYMDAQWSPVSAIDSLEYLQEDLFLSGTYQKELMLFALLISNNVSETYFKTRTDVKAQEIKSNLDRIKAFLLKGAQGAKPNNIDYAFRYLINATHPIDQASLLTIFAEIDALPTNDFPKVEAILNQRYKIMVNPVHADSFVTKDNEALRQVILETLYVFTLVKGGIGVTEAFSEAQNLTDQSPFVTGRKDRDQNTLMLDLNKLWDEESPSLNFVLRAFVLRGLHDVIQQMALEPIPHFGLKTLVLNKIKSMKDFASCNTMQELGRIQEQLSFLANLVGQMISPLDKEKQNVLVNAWNKVDFSVFSNNGLYQTWSALKNLPCAYMQVLFPALALVRSKLKEDQFVGLLGIMQRLQQKNFPPNYIEAIIALAKEGMDEQYHAFIAEVQVAFEHDPNDELLKFVLLDRSISWKQTRQIVQLTKDLEGKHRDQVLQLIQFLQKTPAAFDKLFSLELNGRSASADCSGFF